MFNIGDDLSVTGKTTVEGTTDLNGGASVKGTLSVIGPVTATAPMSAPAFNETSDHRLKKNIKPLLNAIDILNKLKPVEFDWIDKNQHSTGFVAHELQEQISHLVEGQKDGEFVQRVRYTGLIAYLVAAIQEQQGEIDYLKNTINTILSTIRSKE